LGPGNRNQFPVHPGLPAINLVLLLGCGQAEPKARIPGSIGCLCTLQAELDARLMHALDEGDFDFKVVHGAKSCMGQSRAWGKVVHGAKSCVGQIRAWGKVVHGAKSCMGLQVGSLLKEAGLLHVRSLLEEAAWEAAAAGVGRGRGLP